MCEYCKDEMESKPIIDKYAIDTIVDHKFLYNYCDCGNHTVVEINYCPMCGRKLGEKNERFKNNDQSTNEWKIRRTN